MNTRMMFARAVAGAAMAMCLAGCWSPLVVGDTWANSTEWGIDNSPIYGIYLQPLVGFAERKVVGVNVAARMEPDISGDRKPNASEIVGLGVGAVFHEVRGDVCGVQIGGLGAMAKCVDGIQIAGINEASTVNGIQIGLLGNDGCANSQTNTSRCVQIGLVNVCGDHWFPLINFNFRDSPCCGKDEVKHYPWGLKFRPW